MTTIALRPESAVRARWLSRARRLCLPAALLACGVAAWEYMLYLALGELSGEPGAIVLHALFDALQAFPLAFLALALAGRVAAVLSLDRRTISGLGARAAVVSLAFVALLAATVSVRGQVHDRIGAAWMPALLPGPAEAFLDGSSLAPSLCSFAALRASARTTDAGLAEGGEAAWFALRDGLIDQVAALPLAGLAMFWLYRRRAGSRRERSPLRPAWIAVGGTALALSVMTGWITASPLDRTTKNPGAARAALAKAGDPCSTGGPRKIYNVSAISVSMTLNRFGDHDPNAYMYVLDERIDEVRAQEFAALPDRVSPGLRRDPIQPLVLRANLGECVEINFTNRIDENRATGLHILGLPHSTVSYGGAIGYNGDSAADFGETVRYEIPLPSDPDAERSYYFHDHGASRDRVSHGLFGALVAEPAGSVYLDPETAQPLDGNNWEAIIQVPGGVSFREFVIFYHEIGDEDFRDIRDAEDRPLPQVDDITGDIYRPAARALNYRSEPFRNRMRLAREKALGYSSYTFGDPATPIPRSYLGEPTKTRLMHGGSELFHVHHLHGGADRWRRNPKADDKNNIASGLTKVPVQDAFSIHIDSQSIGPGTSFNLEHECGAGGCQQAAGDFLYHCHIGHHYLAGMWSFWRVFDTLKPDLATIPALFEFGNGVAPPKEAVLSFELLGLEVGGKTLVQDVADPDTQIALEAFIESQLPPKGVRLDDEDATVWDWMKVDTDDGPLYFGEPETVADWANYDSATPGVRPPILFNPRNGRYTWPLLRPHLGKRPPFAANGHSGAPWLGEYGSAERPDGLCPTGDVVPGREVRSYPISAIQVPIQISPDRLDPQGQIFVLNEDKDAVFAGTKTREPLAIRSNTGDCVEVLLTNEIPDQASNDLRSKANMHIHFVQFDPQASDGVITGLSYEQSVRPYVNENRFLGLDAVPGDTEIQVSHTSRLRPGISIGIGLGEGVCDDPDGGSQPVACTEVRHIASIAGNVLTLDRPLALPHSAGEAVGVEFVRYNWYSDVDSGTVFYHTHVDFKQWDRGLFGAHIIEPKGSTYHDPVTGEEIRSGTIADIHAPDDSCHGKKPGDCGSFREFMVFLQQIISDRDGLGSINLRSEPFATRLGDPPVGDPAHVFSSVLHGDPMTPLPRAYVGDPFVIRLLGLVERVSGFRMSGHRFPVERFADPGWRVDTTFIGISERFDLVLDGGAGGPAGMPGDYLYYSTFRRDLEGGQWGLLRVHDTEQPDLQPLPGRTPPAGPGFPTLSFTGAAPPAAAQPGDPCPEGAAVRSYNVVMLRADVIYDDASGLKDSGGVVYQLDVGGPAKARPQIRGPLVVRANHKECLEVNLFNAHDVQPGSFHLSEVLFDPQGSYGAAIGYNADSSVAPGQTRKYRFYADRELGTTVLLNLASPASWPAGAYGAVVIEPEDTIAYRHPSQGFQLFSGTHANIETKRGTFREIVTLFADDDPRIGQSTMPYPTAVDRFTGINYSAARLEGRDMALSPDYVFSSFQHGDPRQTYSVPAGHPLIFRVAQPTGEQAHVFATEGHRFYLDGLAHSEAISAHELAPGMAFDAEIIGGAGGDYGSIGDYLFLDRRQPFMEAGLWGILRVTADGPCESSLDCDDGDMCNGVEECVEGSCRAGLPEQCGDGDPCTIDTCHPSDGCSNTFDQQVCDALDNGGDPGDGAIDPPAGPDPQITLFVNGEGCTEPRCTAVTGYSLDPVREFSAGDTAGALGRARVRPETAIYGQYGIDIFTTSSNLVFDVVDADLVPDAAGSVCFVHERTGTPAAPGYRTFMLNAPGTATFLLLEFADDNDLRLIQKDATGVIRSTSTSGWGGAAAAGPMLVQAVWDSTAAAGNLRLLVDGVERARLDAAIGPLQGIDKVRIGNPSSFAGQYAIDPFLISADPNLDCFDLLAGTCAAGGERCIEDGDCASGDICEGIVSDYDALPQVGAPAVDQCPFDPDKTEPGICGCGLSDADVDRDGTPDCFDDCPVDSNKTEPGVCGCGTLDVDGDGDGTPNCADACPLDPAKVAPGDCGCHRVETDIDGDGVSDCLDNCIDRDFDGYGTPGGGGQCLGPDCDDTDPATHPGAEEVCDGADNDCDPSTPECPDPGLSDLGMGLRLFFNGEACTQPICTGGTGYVLDPVQEASTGDSSAALGRVRVRPEAAISGGYGLEIYTASSNAVFDVVNADLVPNEAGSVCMVFQRTGAAPSDGNRKFMLNAPGSASFLLLEHDGPNDLRLSLRDAGGTIHSIVTEWGRAATTDALLVQATWDSSSSDGGLRLLVDGVERARLAGTVGPLAGIDKVRIGNPSGNAGTYSVDPFLISENPNVDCWVALSGSCSVSGAACIDEADCPGAQTCDGRKTSAADFPTSPAQMD